MPQYFPVLTSNAPTIRGDISFPGTSGNPPNESKIFVTDAEDIFNPSGKTTTLLIKGGDNNLSGGGRVNIYGGDVLGAAYDNSDVPSGYTFTYAPGGDINIKGGKGNTNGGHVKLEGGDSEYQYAPISGGDAKVYGGSGVATIDGGKVIIKGGQGVGSGYSGGDVTIDAGRGISSAADGTLELCKNFGGIKFFNGTGQSSRPSVTGSRGGNAALASLLTALDTFGLITDSTT